MTRTLVLLGLLMVVSAPAQAALNLCNRTSYVLYAATSAIQSLRSDTRGWTRIAPGSCEIARKEPLTANTYLVHGRSGIAHSGPARAWGGNYPVCVKDASFSIKQGVTQPICTADDTFALPFAPLDNRGERVWTMNFDEQPALSLRQAQLAGVRRLLKDNGYKIARLDGKPDNQTGAALADFRKRMRFSPTAGNAELFTALEKEALRINAPAGYTVCNDSRDTVLVAVGEAADGKSVSRGWWTVQPQACARAITSPLDSDAVFLFAQKKNGGIVVSGAQKFCTIAPAFEIQGAGNCAARGYAQTGFARTATRGRTGHIVRIGISGLMPGR